MRTRLIATILFALLATPHVASALQPLTPTLVAPITSRALLLRAIPDGSGGAIVVWQEESSLTLRAVHLLPDGTADPAWGPIRNVSDTSAARLHLGLVTDGLGGAYVWWTLGGTPGYGIRPGYGPYQLRLTHLLSCGVPAAGWPATGLAPAGFQGAFKDLRVVSDGDRGVYVAAVRMTADAVATHLGPGGSPAAGWPAEPVTLAPLAAEAESLWDFSLEIERASNGDLWATAGMLSFVVGSPPDCVYRTSDWRLLRYGADGTPAPGWDARGRVLQAYPRDLEGCATDGGYGVYDPFYEARVAGIVRASNDGALVLLSEPVSLVGNGYGVEMDTKLYHVDAAGEPVGPQQVLIDTGRSTRPSSLPDADAPIYKSAVAGGFLMGYPGAASCDVGVPFRLRSATPAGGLGSVDMGAGSGFCTDFLPLSDGSAYLADIMPSADYSCSHATFMNVQHSALGWVFREQQFLQDHAYASLALVAPVANRPWVVWSQIYGRTGLFLMVLPVDSTWTASVDPGTPRAHGLSARWVSGSGVRMRASLDAAGAWKLVLADVAGRRVGEERFAGSPGERRWTVAGTANLPSGLYFARLERDGRVVTSRVVVVR